MCEQTYQNNIQIDMYMCNSINTHAVIYKKQKICSFLLIRVIIHKALTQLMSPWFATFSHHEVSMCNRQHFSIRMILRNLLWQFYSIPAIGYSTMLFRVKQKGISLHYNVQAVISVPIFTNCSVRKNNFTGSFSTYYFYATLQACKLKDLDCPKKSFVLLRLS